VASVWALASFTTGPSNISTSPGNGVGLIKAFASVNKLVDTADGVLSGPALPTGATIPKVELNTLVDIIAPCIDTYGDRSACGKLLALAVSSTGANPTDVVTATLDIAHNPTRNIAALNKLGEATGPFQPILSPAPFGWTIAIQYPTAGLSGPTGIAADGSGNVWVTNEVGHAVTLLNPSGAVAGTCAMGQSGNGAIAIGLGGNA
jgi:hypothetical protein